MGGRKRCFYFENTSKTRPSFHVAPVENRSRWSVFLTGCGDGAPWEGRLIDAIMQTPPGCCKRRKKNDHKHLQQTWVHLSAVIAATLRTNNRSLIRFIWGGARASCRNTVNSDLFFSTPPQGVDCVGAHPSSFMSGTYWGSFHKEGGLFTSLHTHKRPLNTVLSTPGCWRAPTQAGTLCGPHDSGIKGA